jgi:hypothetical protein
LRSRLDPAPIKFIAKRCDNLQGYLIGRPHKAEVYGEYMYMKAGDRLKTAS